jgi:alpha-1,4-galacturonosyltransferase
LHSQQDGVIFNEEGKENSEGGKMDDDEQKKTSNDAELLTNFQEDDTGSEHRDVKDNALADNLQLEESPTKVLRRQLRQKRREKRSTELIQQDEEERIELENAAIKRSKEVDSAVLGKYSIWRRENENENSDSTVRLMRDQLIMARVYSSISQARNNLDLYQELMLRIKECQRTLGEANADSDLPQSAPEKIKAMGHVLSKAREQFYDCATVTKKLRAMLQSADEQVRTLKKQSTFLSQLAAKTVPKGLHCLSMRLTIDYYLLPLEKRKFPKEDKLEDPTLYHYALFSDNVLAASVVVNSTIMNAKDSEKHVFHLVTDKLNFGAMKMWFLLNPPGKAAIHVENVDDFKWLNSSYCPVLRQLESAAMKEYYFKADHPTTLSAGSSNLKYRNPKYLSMLNHLRFYLPQVYPKLDKILFLDDDIVVQKDLTPLWSVDLHGKVNGAVETCGESFHRFDKYLNFSNPHIARHFDPNACGWAYGMNVFDLKEWKKQDITGIYHKWQNMNEDRVLWKLGTLPPGLITFYGLTHPLDKSWHVLGLGYNPSVDRSEIDNAAVVHYNGNMKPWLELAMTKYRPYWTKYIKYDHPFLQQCNINE